MGFSRIAVGNLVPAVDGGSLPPLKSTKVLKLLANRVMQDCPSRVGPCSWGAPGERASAAPAAQHGLRPPTVTVEILGRINERMKVGFLGILVVLWGSDGI